MSLERVVMKQSRNIQRTGKKSVWQLGILFLLVFAIASMGALLTGCAMQNAKTNEPAKDLALQTETVTLIHKIGNKVSDGQYVIVTLKMQNLTKVSKTIGVDKFAIELVSEEGGYSQPVEKGLSFEYAKMAGKEKREKVLDMQPVVLHPQIQAERYAIFTLPVDAELERYQIRVDNAVTPVLGEQTYVQDLRNAG